MPQHVASFENAKAFRVAGIEAATCDLVIVAPAARIDAVLSARGLARSGVSFVEDAAPLLAAASEIKPLSEADWGGGGTVANTLHAMAHPVRAQDLFWLGVASAEDSAATADPLASLRRLGIAIESSPHQAGNRLAACWVNEEDGEVRATFLAPGQRHVEPRPDWPEVDLVLLTLQSLESMPPSLLSYVERTPALVILVGDTPSVSAGVRERLAAWAGQGRLRSSFGHVEDFRRLGWLAGDGAVSAFASVEMVGTRGDRGVAIWDPQRRRCIHLSVLPQPIPAQGSALGAGDRYAGGYLRARLLGSAPEQAHAVASTTVRDVLCVRGSRAPVSSDLNALFGDAMEGRVSSSPDEGRLFDRVRLTCGLTVVTCGQTGIDQLTLRAAADIGLPAFAVMPSGLRTETRDRRSPPAADDLSADLPSDDFADALVVALGSASYRYCTWTNVFLGDGSLIWDFRGSEGCAATRQACRTLGRPFLDMAALEPAEAVARAREWARRHAVRVVHVAGNRRTLLGRDTGAAFARIRSVLTALAFQRVELAAGARGGQSSPAPARDAGYGGLCVGIPNTPESRGLFSRFLRSTYGVEPPADRRLLDWHFPDLGLELLLARVRDLPKMVDQGLLDAAFCGSDIVDEHGNVHPVLLDTGLEPCLLVVLRRKARSSVTAAERPRILASQYPAIADRLVGSRTGIARVLPILGTAESWVATGCCDGALDTWRTGATADANDLELVTIVRSTSLVAVGRREPAARQRDRFLAELASWLARGGVP